MGHKNETKGDYITKLNYACALLSIYEKGSASVFKQSKHSYSSCLVNQIKENTLKDIAIAQPCFRVSLAITIALGLERKAMAGH